MTPSASDPRPRRGRPAAAGPRSARGRGAAAGFVLLEILMALTIFTFVVLAWLQATDRAVASAAEANANRVLSMLARRKLDEVRARPRAFVDGAEGGFEEEVAPGEANPYADYAWSVEAEEVVVAGRSDDTEAVYLFERDALDADEPPAADATGDAQKPPEAVILTRFIVVVRWIEGEIAMRAVTYVPIRIDPADEEAESGAGGQ